MSSEFDLIGRYFNVKARRAALGVGDDCALLYAKPGVQLALSIDTLVENVHFLEGTDPEKLGRKTLAVNLSDLAAMGADPAYALLAVTLPQMDEDWVSAFARGFLATASQYGVELIGGDTTRGPRSFSVTVIGEVPSGLALRRDGAQPGDDVWVSGPTGEAALGLAHLQKQITLPEAAAGVCTGRLQAPVPRVELGGRLRGLATSAIDVSDGLVADLGHVARASAVAIIVQADQLQWTPALLAASDRAHALECITGGGDDYEIAFTAPALRRAEVASLSAELALAMVRIGVVTPGDPGAVLLDAAGKPVRAGQGFDHFALRR